MRALQSAALSLLLLGCPGPGPSLEPTDGGAADAPFSSGFGEICGNGMDDDGDGASDCADPECAAPELDEETTFVEANRYYLYAGSGACPMALQTGVVDGAIDESLFAVVRGRVFDRDTGAALGGARVFVEGQPDLGETRTRADGLFELAVNAGTSVPVSVTLDGYLPMQRAVPIAPHDYAWAGDMAMTRRDTASTVVRLDSDSPQVHQSSLVSDADGSRRCTVVIPSGTTAEVRSSDGSVRPVSQLTLRTTEFTVGPRGPEAMPGLLPDASAYTYAIEVSADETNPQTDSIEFSDRVSMFAENFLGFPVGTAVPVGSYDRRAGAWVAERDGRIVRVLGTDDDGRALFDLDGDGERDSGIPPSIRAGIGGRYPAGTELMWVQVEHFTPFDWNWGWGAPDGARPPHPPRRRDQRCFRSGSIIECDTQVLGETIPLVGGGGALNYASSRVPGRRPAQRVEVPSV